MADEQKSKAMVKPDVSAGFSPIVRPAVSAIEAKEAWKAYQDLKKSIIDEKDDIQLIQGRKFLKKSYWRKLATFFNLSVEVAEERVVETPTKNVIFHFVCKATAPNGRFAVGSGSSDKFEKGYPNTLHNTRATAETRAFNRAVSNLVGGGEVSAEEVSQDVSTKEVATEAQVKKIFALGKTKGRDADQLKEKVKERFSLGSFTELTKSQAAQVIDALEQAPAV